MSTDEAPPAPPRRLRDRARAQLTRLLHEDASPARLGVAVGLGVVIGCLPIFGFQTLVALALAWALQLNKIAVVLGTQISIPPTTPLLVFGSANLGELMLHGHLLPLTLDELRGIPLTELARRFLLAWTLGGLVVGLVLGVLLGTATALVVRRHRARRA